MKDEVFYRWKGIDKMEDNLHLRHLDLHKVIAVSTSWPRVCRVYLLADYQTTFQTPQQPVEL